MSIAETIETLKRDWSSPRRTVGVTGSAADFDLVCRFSDPAGSTAPIRETIPDDLHEFWQLAASADLFTDDTFGQWGLRILAPDECRPTTDAFFAARSTDALRGDLVVGRFYGDSDLLLIRTDRMADDFGAVLVALPLDARPDWFRVSQSLSAFLKDYAARSGDKFWEAA